MSDKAIIQIFRGDDTDAIGCENIVGTITTDLDISGCTVTFQYLGFTQSFTGLSSGDTFTVVIPHAVTKTFPPGLGYASVKVYDTNEKIRTFNNRIPVFVKTSTPFNGDGSSFDVTFNENDNYEALNNKPQINGVELIGDKSSSELGLQSEITDINAIRSGAAKGASSVQTVNHTAPDASGNVNINVVTDYANLTNKPAIDGVTLTKDSTADGLGLAKTSDLATVAISGSYDDLTNKPTIPTAVTIDDALSSTSTNPVQNKVVTAALAEKRDKTDLAVYQRVFSCVNIDGVTVAKVYFAPKAGSLPERVIVYDSDGTTALTDVTMAQIQAGATGWADSPGGDLWHYGISWSGVAVGFVEVDSTGAETFCCYNNSASTPLNFNGYIRSIGETEYHTTAYNGTITDLGVIAGDDTLAKTSDLTADNVSAIPKTTGSHLTEAGCTTDYLLNSSFNGGPRIRVSSSNLDNYTAFAYKGVAVRRNGVTADYLFDNTQNGIARLRDIPAVDSALTSSSANPVKSSSIWSALWGSVTSSFTSITAWVQNLLTGYLQLSGGTLTGELNVQSDETIFGNTSGAHIRIGGVRDGSDGPNSPSSPYHLIIDSYGSLQLYGADGTLLGSISVPSEGASGIIATLGDLRYALGSSITASATLADRTANRVVAGASNTTQIALAFPAAVPSKMRDFTVLATRETGNTGGIAFTTPTGATIYGDGFSTAIAEGKTVLYAITEVAANTWYTRAIKMEVAS